MEITINGEVSENPKTRILALEAIVKSICEYTKQDTADGVMMLLVAAAHITIKSTGKPLPQTAMLLAESLGNAIAIADDFFNISEVKPRKPHGMKPYG